MITLYSETRSDFYSKLLLYIDRDVPDLCGRFTLAEIMGDEKYFLDTITAHLSGKAEELGILLEITSIEYLNPKK